MTYQITVSASKQSEFLQIIESLLRLGVVKKYIRAESLVVPGEPVAIDALLQTLAESEKQVEGGLSFSPAEAKLFIKSWQERTGILRTKRGPEVFESLID